MRSEGESSRGDFTVVILPKPRGTGNTFHLVTIQPQGVPMRTDKDFDRAVLQAVLDGSSDPENPEAMALATATR